MYRNTLAAAVVLLAASPALALSAGSDVDDCAWTAAGSAPPLTAKLCTAEPQTCAVLLNSCFLKHKYGAAPGFNFADSPNWWLFTSGEGLRQNVAQPRHFNQVTPQHGRYLSVYVNKVAADAIREVLAAPVAPDDVRLPHGSVIAKLNYSGPDAQPAPPWLTVMAKVDGYCPKTVGGACDGGDWFYYLSRFGAFLSFEEITGVDPDGKPSVASRTPAFGKPSAFCTDCHNPVEATDFLWTLNAALWKTRPATKPAAAPDAGGTAPPDDGCAEATSRLSSELPPDLPTDPSRFPTPQAAQKMFDCFSWRSFVALNWAADPGERGQPDTRAKFPALGKERVWESYKETFEVFQPGDPDWTVRPEQWNERPAVPAACKAVIDGLDGATRAALTAGAPKALRMASKTRANQVLNETHQAFGNQFNILIDQDGRLVRYEVRFNRDEFQYLAENGYADTGAYSYSGPKGVAWGAVAFPTNATGVTGAGAIEIKAAWRELCAGPTCTPAEAERAKRYYARPALKYVPPIGKEPAKCTLIGQAGLIGLHVIRKTERAPQWVWSTFEHVDNVPPAGSEPAAGVTYTLFDPQCAKPEFRPSEQACASQRPGVLPAIKRPDLSTARARCCANLQLLENAMPAAVKAAVGAGPPQTLLRNHVTRLDPIGPQDLNRRVSDLIAKADPDNPFRFYRLVNTQWASGGRDPKTGAVRTLSCAQLKEAGRSGAPCYTLEPRKGNDSLRLRNTTMETFQVSIGDGPGATHFSSAGCMNCHGASGVDFSFVFLDAEEIRTPIRGGGN